MVQELRADQSQQRHIVAIGGRLVWISSDLLDQALRRSWAEDLSFPNGLGREQRVNVSRGTALNEALRVRSSVRLLCPPQDRFGQQICSCALEQVLFVKDAQLRFRWQGVGEGDNLRIEERESGPRPSCPSAFDRLAMIEGNQIEVS
jgi:hypothetical protein